MIFLFLGESIPDAGGCISLVVPFRPSHASCVSRGMRSFARGFKASARVLLSSLGTDSTVTRRTECWRIQSGCRTTGSCDDLDRLHSSSLFFTLLYTSSCQSKIVKKTRHQGLCYVGILSFMFQNTFLAFSYIKERSILVYHF